MLKKAIMVLSVILATQVLAGSSASCGTKITCKPGNKARCEMINGSSTLFQQVNHVNFTTATQLFLKDLYSYRAGAQGFIDCYYSEESSPENWLVFKTGIIHNVIPRDSTEWVKRGEMMQCDPDINTCLLYALY